MWKIFVATILLQAAVEISSNFTISITRDFDVNHPSNGFQVYWNVPTFLCRRHKVEFENLLKSFGFTVNSKADFWGDKNLILYDPGAFPVVLKDTKTGKLKILNGGIPQKGDLNMHLEEFEKAVNTKVAANFSGLAVIDFETWRPIYRQNWKSQTLYQNLSLALVREQHPNWTKDKIAAQAKTEFEKAARRFMQETLKRAKSIRPNAQWGYYGFPYCMNYGKDGTPKCPFQVREENNRTKWLFLESGALYLSLYIGHKLNPEQHRLFTIGRLNEAWRMATLKKSDMKPVHPYVRYSYFDNGEFLTEKDMYTMLKTIRSYKMGGAIIWGSSTDFTRNNKCSDLYNYVENTLGPIVKKLVQQQDISRLEADQEAEHVEDVDMAVEESAEIE